MSRQFVVTVEAYPSLTDSLYRMLVRSVARHSSGQLEICLEHISEEQRARTHLCLLRLPVYPAGTTAQFFSATGFKIDLGATIKPAEAVGKTILVRFEPATPGTNEYRPAAFEPLTTSTEVTHVK